MQGQAGAGERETLMFWINQVGFVFSCHVKVIAWLKLTLVLQDIIVPEAEWRDVLVTAVKASTAKARGVDIEPLQ
jgi:hypothetical protein